MSEIDTYIYLGDEQVVGGQIGQKPVTGFPNLVGLATLVPEIQRVVPSGPDGITGGTYEPWYDGFYVKRYGVLAGATTTVVQFGGSPQWKVNYLAGRTLTIESGTGSGQTGTVLSNTVDSVTLSAPLGVAPGAGSICHFGPGNFVKYHYGRGLIPGLEGTGGDCWMEADALSASLMLMHKLGRQYENTNGGFRFLKTAAPGGFGGGSQPIRPGAINSAFPIVLSRIADMRAIEEGRGNTLKIKAVILDFSTSDIFNVNFSYLTHLNETLDAVRAQISSDCLILLVNQPAWLAKTLLPGVAKTVRDTHRLVITARRTAGDNNIRLYDMSWGVPTWDPLGAPGVEHANPRYYTLETYIQAGVGLYNAVQSHFVNADSIIEGNGIPTIIMIGDSQLVTAGMNPAQVFFGNEASLLGDDPLNTNSTVRTKTWIWDDIQGMVVPYDVMSNASTFPDNQNTFFGPENTLLADVVKAKGACVVFKFAQAGVALTEDALAYGAPGYVSKGGPTWDTIASRYKLFKLSVLQQLGKVPDVIGVFTSLGENDIALETTITAFENEVEDFIDDVRDLFTTRTDGKPLPVAYLQGPPSVYEVEGGSTLGPLDRRNRYRAKVASLATKKERLKVLLNDGPSTYELQRGDKVHYAGQAVYKIGRDAAAALLQLNSEEGETTGVVTTTTENQPSSTAAFIPEDGSGLASANSLTTVEFATQYLSQFKNPTAWIQAEDAMRKDALRQVSRWISLKKRFGGQIKVLEQSLAFPRINLYTDEDEYVDSDTVPLNVQGAAAELANAIIEKIWEPFPVDAPASNAVSESFSIGPISFSNSYAGSKVNDSESVLSVANNLLRPYYARSRGRLGRG